MYGSIPPPQVSVRQPCFMPNKLKAIYFSATTIICSLSTLNHRMRKILIQINFYFFIKTGHKDMAHANAINNQSRILVT